MTISITDTDDLITSDAVSVVAYFSRDAAANGEGAWILPWLGEKRLFDRSQAETAMTLAEYVAKGHGADAFTETWAAELQLKPDDVMKLLAAVLGEKPAPRAEAAT